jgi:hypothetical protein
MPRKPYSAHLDGLLETIPGTPQAQRKTQAMTDKTDLLTSKRIDIVIRAVNARMPNSVTPATRIEIHPSEWIELVSEVMDLRGAHETPAPQNMHSDEWWQAELDRCVGVEQDKYRALFAAYTALKAANARPAMEPTPKPARDAEHCDFPDCEQHNALIVEDLRRSVARLLPYAQQYAPADAADIEAQQSVVQEAEKLLAGLMRPEKATGTPKLNKFTGQDRPGAECEHCNRPRREHGLNYECPPLNGTGDAK